MNRKLMLGIAAFLAIVGMALLGGDNQAEAGFGGCGGLFARGCDGGGHSAGRRCGGRLFNRGARCGGGCAGAVVPACAPAADPCPPVCGGHAKKCGGGLFARLKAKHAARKAKRNCCGEPDPCAPAPCAAPAPAPAPCCEPAPAPCCASAPAPCCGEVYSAAPAAVSSPSDEMPTVAGEEIVPGSVKVISDGAAAPAPAADGT